jgi:hypothetical protein
MPRKPHHVNIIATQYTVFIELGRYTKLEHHKDYKLHPNHQYPEIFEIINFKGHTLESTDWLSRNTAFRFHSFLTSVISQLSGFIPSDVFAPMLSMSTNGSSLYTTHLNSTCRNYGHWSAW